MWVLSEDIDFIVGFIGLISVPQYLKLEVGFGVQELMNVIVALKLEEVST